MFLTMLITWYSTILSSYVFHPRGWSRCADPAAIEIISSTLGITRLDPLPVKLNWLSWSRNLLYRFPFQSNFHCESSVEVAGYRSLGEEARRLLAQWMVFCTRLRNEQVTRSASLSLQTGQPFVFVVARITRQCFFFIDMLRLCHAFSINIQTHRLALLCC